jgi:hypothetical protein
MDFDFSPSPIKAANEPTTSSAYGLRLSEIYGAKCSSYQPGADMDDEEGLATEESMEPDDSSSCEQPIGASSDIVDEEQVSSHSIIFYCWNFQGKS